MKELLGNVNIPGHILDKRLHTAQSLQDPLTKNCTEWQSWRVQSARLREKHNLPSRLPKYPGKMQGLPRTDRIHDLVQVAWAIMGRRALAHGQRCFLDASQCVSREPWSDHIPTLTQSALIFCFVEDRALQDEEIWACQGLLAELFPTTGSTLNVRQIVGEGQFLPCTAIVAAAMHYNPFAPWWQALE